MSKETVLYKEGVQYATSEQLIEALNGLGDRLTLVSSGGDYYRITEVVIDEEGDVLFRANQRY